MARDRKGKALTRTEFEAVMKRATELASSDPLGPEGLIDEEEMYRIAREVGLPDSHVRRALVEVRSDDVPGGVVDRWFGSKRIRVSREIQGVRDALAGQIDEFFVAGHLMQRVRRGTDLMTYRPAADWLSGFARAGSSMSQKVYWASSKEVEVRLDQVAEDRVLVELDIDPGIRAEYVMGGTVGGAAAWGGSAIGMVVLMTSLSVAAPLAATVAIAAGGGLGTFVAWQTGRAAKARRRQVQDELEGVLDILERGEDLIPPPASWRRWVKRQAERFKVELFGDSTNTT